MPLIPSQALSGKQPWSELRDDTLVIVRLVMGHKPARPECQTLHDSHWSFIQQCWSPMEERPTAKSIVSTIQQFLNQSTPACALGDVVTSLLSQADKVPRQPATLVNEIPSNEDGVRYVVSSSFSACHDICSIRTPVSTLADAMREVMTFHH